jgi:cytochrome P450
VVGYHEARRALSDHRLSKDPSLVWEAAARGADAPGLHDASASGADVPGAPAVDREPRPGAAPGAKGAGPRWIRNAANTDPPEHTRLRRLLTAAFTRRRVERMRPGIEQAAKHLADRLPSDAEVDLIASFAFPLQVEVTCNLLGVPSQHREAFASLAAGMLAAGDGEHRPASCHEAYRQLGTLMAQALAAVRANLEADLGMEGRADDRTGIGATSLREGAGAARCSEVGIPGGPDRQPHLLGALLAARHGPDRLTEQEAHAMAMLLITAGQEPTIDLIANGVLALLLHPDQLQLVRRYPHLRASAVEELLRFSVPVLAAPRIAAEDIEIDGTTVPRGTVLAVMLEAAHRDPAHFAAPNTLNVTRDHNAHLAFGHGIHYCVGAPLARMQAAIAIGALVDRFPRISLAQTPEQLRWRPSRDARGLVELPVFLARAEPVLNR